MSLTMSAPKDQWCNPFRLVPANFYHAHTAESRLTSIVLTTRITICFCNARVVTPVCTAPLLKANRPL